MLLFVLFIALTFMPSMSSASDQRPFWTEQASFAFDNTLYVIGVASNAESIEAGRQAAFDHGLREIRNYAQTENLNNLQVHTQMNYEEPQSDGRVSVWRLLRVSMARLAEQREQLKMVKGELRVVKNSEVAQVRQEPRSTHEVHAVQEARMDSTPSPHTTPVMKPSPALRATDTTHEKISLPTIPLRYPQIITGWTQDTHGRIGVQSEDRQEWYVPVLKASDLTYATR
jgi:hypothetical protein